MTTADRRRPWLCRQGFHHWGPNTLWPGSTPDLTRWQRHCPRCGAALSFTVKPFTYGAFDRRRERRRASAQDRQDRAGQ